MSQKEVFTFTRKPASPSYENRVHLQRNTHSILCTVFLCSINLFAQETFTAKVVGVVDGDTITVFTKDKRQLMFRLAGIDAPEKDQDFGANARQFLFTLVLNQTITVTNFKKDCLNSFTGSVVLGDKNLSLAAVQSGNAWADTSCQTDQSLLKEESLAKEKKLGLWQNPNPVRPQEFRKSKQEPAPLQVTQTDGRRIFTGLAPTPPPIPGKPEGLYIGMRLDDFIQLCGETGQKSEMFTSEGYQHFYITIPKTKESSGKNCGGQFSFQRTLEHPVFKLDSVIQ